jgi:hypothetical protein
MPHLQAVKAAAIVDLQEGKSTSTSLTACLHPATNPERSAHLHIVQPAESSNIKCHRCLLQAAAAAADLERYVHTHQALATICSQQQRLDWGPAISSAVGRNMAAAVQVGLQETGSTLS